MARARLEIGEYGKLVPKEVEPGKFRVRAKLRISAHKVVEVTGTGRSAEAARRAFTKRVKQRLEESQENYTQITLMKDLIDSWWVTVEEQYQSGHIIESTLEAYKRQRNTVLEAMGHLEVKEVSAGRVSQFLQGYKDKPSVQKELKRTLKSAFNYALTLDLIPANFVGNIKITPKKKSPVVSYSAEDVATMLQILEDYESGGLSGTTKNGKRIGGRTRAKYLHDFVQMMLFTGTRISEMLGLRWIDVDLEAERPTVSIKGIAKTRKVDTDKGLGYLEWQPFGKTKDSLRTITLTSDAVALLKRLKAAKGLEDKYVFSNIHGGLRSPENVRRGLRKARDEANSDMQISKTHTLRKTFATVIANQHGVYLTSQNLGHSNTRVTEDAYVGRGRIAPDVTDAMEDFFKASKVG